VPREPPFHGQSRESTPAAEPRVRRRPRLPRAGVVPQCYRREATRARRQRELMSMRPPPDARSAMLLICANTRSPRKDAATRQRSTGSSSCRCRKARTAPRRRASARRRQCRAKSCPADRARVRSISSSPPLIGPVARFAFRQSSRSGSTAAFAAASRLHLEGRQSLPGGKPAELTGGRARSF
jgi:hypothetical protein